MRKEFSQWMNRWGQDNEKVIFLTGDLGFQALESIQSSLGDRFVNVGVCEQNMILLAAGLAQQGLWPVCYSIAPFAVFRPFEQIRVDVAIHNKRVKIVGNGGGYGYGMMGATHHALEDIAVLSALPNFQCVIPVSNQDVAGACESCFNSVTPSYLRLGFGLWPGEGVPLPPFAPIRNIFRSTASRPAVTIAAMGPVALNFLPWIRDRSEIDFFLVSEIPCPVANSDLSASVAKSNNLWVVEEHTARGGLGEYLISLIAKEGINCRFHHSSALGYPGQVYGSQSFHQKQSQLDRDSLIVRLDQILASL